MERMPRSQIVQQEGQSHCDIFHQGGTETIGWTYNKIFTERNCFWEKIIDDGDLYRRIQTNIINRIKGSSVWESCSSKEASIQNLIQEVTAVVFEKEDLDFRDLSEPKSLLPILAYQDSNSDVEIIFLDTLETNSLLQV